MVIFFGWSSLLNIFFFWLKPWNLLLFGLIHKELHFQKMTDVGVIKGTEATDCCK